MTILLLLTVAQLWLGRLFQLLARRFVQRGTGSFNANGQRGQNNNFMVDGIDNNESWINSTILQPSVEANEEFKVYTANPPAEFGRASGGIVNVQVRSGTNEIHGSAYDYLRNSSLDAAFLPRRLIDASRPGCERLFKC